MKLFKNSLFVLLLAVAGSSGAVQQNRPAANVPEGVSQASQEESVFGSAHDRVINPEQRVSLMLSQPGSAVPEPETWTMIVLGLGFVVFQIRRRRKKNDSWDLK